MPFPEDELRADERITLHLHPNWTGRALAAVFWMTFAAIAGFCFSRYGSRFGLAAVDSRYVYAAIAAVGVFLGLGTLINWLRTHLVVTNQRILFKGGALWNTRLNVPLSAIVSSRATWLGRAERKSGTLVLETVAGPLVFRSAPHVVRVSRTIEESVAWYAEKADSELVNQIRSGLADRPFSLTEPTTEPADQTVIVIPRERAHADTIHVRDVADRAVLLRGLLVFLAGVGLFALDRYADLTELSAEQSLWLRAGAGLACGVGALRIMAVLFLQMSLGVMLARTAVLCAAAVGVDVFFPWLSPDQRAIVRPYAELIGLTVGAVVALLLAFTILTVLSQAFDDSRLIPVALMFGVGVIAASALVSQPSWLDATLDIATAAAAAVIFGAALYLLAQKFRLEAPARVGEAAAGTGLAGTAVVALSIFAGSIVVTIPLAIAIAIGLAAAVDGTVRAVRGGIKPEPRYYYHPPEPFDEDADLAPGFPVEFAPPASPRISSPTRETPPREALPRQTFKDWAEWLRNNPKVVAAATIIGLVASLIQIVQSVASAITSLIGR